MPLAWYAWLIGFGLTLAIELPIVFPLLRKADRHWTRRLTAAVAANLLTHPLVWFFFPQIPLGSSQTLAISELWAFGAEACFYGYFVANLGWQRATVASALANATSFGIGWIIVRRFGHFLFF